MAIQIVIPQLGESVVEGTIGKWLKKEGEKVDKDEPIVEIATDKINIEIPSPKAGILAKILVKEGTVVPVGQQIGILAEPGNPWLIFLLLSLLEKLLKNRCPRRQFLLPAAQSQSRKKRRTSRGFLRQSGAWSKNIT